MTTSNIIFVLYDDARNKNEQERLFGLYKSKVVSSVNNIGEQYINGILRNMINVSGTDGCNCCWITNESGFKSKSDSYLVGGLAWNPFRSDGDIRRDILSELHRWYHTDNDFCIRIFSVKDLVCEKLELI